LNALSTAARFRFQSSGKFHHAVQHDRILYISEAGSAYRVFLYGTQQPCQRVYSTRTLLSPALPSLISMLLKPDCIPHKEQAEITGERI
jgi:hypothetical protein